jgi:predicted P-loop ATPase
MFAGTTNEDQFLVDDTGNRRFYPVCPLQCHTSRLEDDRDQLFAEALQIYLADPINWWIVTDDAEAVQEHHRIIDPWEDVLRDMDDFSFRQIGVCPYTGFKVHDLAHKVFKIDHKDLTKITGLRISAALKKLGFRRGVTTLKDRSTVRVWRKDPMPVGSHNPHTAQISGADIPCFEE